MLCRKCKGDGILTPETEEYCYGTEGIEIMVCYWCDGTGLQEEVKN